MSAAKTKSSGPTLRIRHVRSGIGFNKTQKATLRALGFKKLQQVRTHPDNPQIRGMIAAVSHLVEVEKGS